MEDKKYKIADLQEKSEEWKIPFSNLLAGFVLEEFMLRFSASEFKNRFLLRNGTVLGLEQYRKKNILKLDFFCEPDERIPEKLLQLYLQKKEQSPVRWKGTISSQQAGTCLELQGQFEEMKVPVTVGIHFMHLGKIWGLVERQIPFLMDETVQIEWKEFPAELVLAKQIFVILRDMELIPDMEIYREVFFILRNETLNGRHVCELLEDMCKTEEMIPDMERAEQIFSYRDYPYMKKQCNRRDGNFKMGGGDGVFSSFPRRYVGGCLQGRSIFWRLDAGTGAFPWVKRSQTDFGVITEDKFSVPDNNPVWYLS